MFAISLFSKPSDPYTDGRSCPACRGRVARDEAVVRVRGMRFHVRCARYRSRSRSVPLRQR